MGEHAEDAIDALLFGSDKEWHDAPRAQCRACGKGGLKWVQAAEGEAWVLCGAGNAPHVCDTARVHKAVMNDFDAF